MKKLLFLFSALLFISCSSEDDEQNNCFDCEIEDQAMTMSYSACEDGILTYTVNGITERETWTSNFDSFEDLKKSLNLLGCELKLN
tara:strand:- start:203 stop:460 length:258 start_codon:yes stop_codon:yes gene_type:complete